MKHFAKVELKLPDGRGLGCAEMARVPCVGEHVMYMDPTAFVVVTGRVSYVRLVAKNGDLPDVAFDAQVTLEAT